MVYYNKTEVIRKNVSLFSFQEEGSETKENKQNKTNTKRLWQNFQEFHWTRTIAEDALFLHHL
jgi:hypothetical protein